MLVKVRFLLYTLFSHMCSIVWLDQCLSPPPDVNLLKGGTISILLSTESVGASTLPGTKQMVSKYFWIV
jgi:hypothetical protein